MKLIGIKGAKMHEVIQYKYAYVLNDKELENIKELVKALFFNDVNKISSFDIHADYRNKLSSVNDVPYDLSFTTITLNINKRFEETMDNMRCFDNYLKRNFNAEGLSITETILDGNLLICYALEARM